jgi:hypothetical protein
VTQRHRKESVGLQLREEVRSARRRGWQGSRAPRPGCAARDSSLEGLASYAPWNLHPGYLVVGDMLEAVSAEKGLAIACTTRVMGLAGQPVFLESCFSQLVCMLQEALVRASVKCPLHWWGKQGPEWEGLKADGFHHSQEGPLLSWSSLRHSGVAA